MAYSPKLLAIAILAGGLAGPVAADEFTRSGPRGDVTKTYDPDTGLTVNRNGVNGGSSSATVTCTRFNCDRNYSVTNPDGETVTGQRKSRWGRYRGGSVNTVTGPQGETITRVRPAYRYNRVHRRRW